MPIIPSMRNPFRNKQDENVRPISSSGLEQSKSATSISKPVEIKETKEPTEYKLSEINDSGVYLPPSPTERKSFWSTNSSRSTTSTTNHRSALKDCDQFNISRESFESYRRSFDISARSPVVQACDPNGRPRISLDSRSFALPPRASLDSRTFAPPPPRSSNSFQRPSQVPAQTEEEKREDFEDVDIQDKPVQAPKKRGLFSRITDSGEHTERPHSADGGKWHSHFTGRKRGQSGQGSELGAIPKREGTPKLESGLKKEALHTKQSSVDVKGREVDGEATSKPGKVEAHAKPMNVESQATGGAKADEAKADSGVDVEAGMQSVNLDDSNETPKARKVESQAEKAEDVKSPPQTADTPNIVESKS